MNISLPSALLRIQLEQQEPVAQNAAHGRPAHVMVGRLKRKGIRNISPYKRSKIWTRIPLVIENRLVLILLGLYM